MKKILLFLSFLLISIGAWSDSYTITFSNNASSATAISSSLQASTTISSDSRTYVTSSPYTVNNGNCYYGDTHSCIRIGKSGSDAELEITLSTSGQVSATNIIVNCMRMTGNKNVGATLSVNGNTSQSAPTSANNLTFSVNDDITSIVLTSEKAVFVYSITVNYSSTPTPTTYTVTYSDGGSGIIEDATVYTFGANVTTRKNTFTKDGYIFDCWLLGNRMIDENSTFVITRDTTLTAKWLTDVYKDETIEDCIFSEEFNNIDYNGQPPFNAASPEVIHDDTLSGWERFKVYSSKNCIKIGSDGYIGFIKTPTIEKNNDNLLLTFKAGAWNNNNENKDIAIIPFGCSVDKDTITLVKNEWKIFNIKLYNINDNGFSIKWSAVSTNKNRFFLDSICISPYKQETPIDIVTWHKDSIFLSKNYFNDIDFKADSIRIKPLQTKKKLYEMPDSTLKVNVDLSGSYCDTLHFIVCNSTEAIEQHIKIPYIVESTDATDAISADKDCDVVIHKTLTINNKKENKDVTVYPGGLLNVNSKYTVNSLTLRRDNDSVPYLLHKDSLGIKNGMFFEMRTDGSAWRWLTLPDTFRINTIDANNSEDYTGLALVKYYNGDIRADKGRGGWKLAPADTIFAPGRGVTFGAYIPESDIEKKIYKIQLDTNILTKEKSDKEVLVYPYGYGLSNKPVNDLGWNVVGNPFMSKCNISADNPIKIGYLREKDGKWTVVEDDLKYIVIKDNHDEYADAGYYKVVPLSIDGCNLEPFTSFFVQIPVTDPDPATLTFTKGSGISYAPSRVKVKSNPFIRINIGNK